MEIEVTYMCDRTQFNFAKSQIGFLGFVTGPYFSAISRLVPKITEQVETIDSNKVKY